MAMMHALDRRFVKYFTLTALLAVGICELVVALAIRLGFLNWQTNVDYQIITVLPLFALALLQLYYNGRLQRSEFIRKYSEKFFTNQELYSAFHELVYQYTDSIFDKVNDDVKVKEASGALGDGTSRPYFVSLDVNTGRVEGKRFYHPKYFQGSAEERRLDMLIGYFDLIGYHHDQGFFSIEEIAGSLGHYLNILSKREIVRYVREVYLDSVRDSRYAQANGYIRPFNYFEKLMKSTEKFNSKIDSRVKKSLDVT